MVYMLYLLIDLREVAESDYARTTMYTGEAPFRMPLWKDFISEWRYQGYRATHRHESGTLRRRSMLA